MFVVVAAQAFCIQSQKRFAEIDLRIELARIVHNLFRLMAALAGLQRVFVFQPIAGLIMIEISFAAGPENHVEISAIVIAVTFETSFAVFAHYCKMIAALIYQALCDFSMAIQTFLYIRAAADGMTLGAIGHALQIGVGLRQWTGRNLRSRRGCQ